jgi:hypothetical protein
MAKALKPDNLDEATLRIAQRMLSTPPKPHKEMKLHKPRTKVLKSPAKKRARGPDKGK